MIGRELVANNQQTQAEDAFPRMLARLEELLRQPTRTDDEEEVMDRITRAVVRELVFAYRNLQKDNAKLRRTLDDRILVDISKNKLIYAKRIPEKEAYRRLRQAAMDYQQPIGVIAQRVIDGGNL